MRCLQQYGFTLSPWKTTMGYIDNLYLGRSLLYYCKNLEEVSLLSVVLMEALSAQITWISLRCMCMRVCACVCVWIYWYVVNNLENKMMLLLGVLSDNLVIFSLSYHIKLQYPYYLIFYYYDKTLWPIPLWEDILYFSFSLTSKVISEGSQDKNSIGEGT